jgi:hypothetical protein
MPRTDSARVRRSWGAANLVGGSAPAPEARSDTPGGDLVGGVAPGRVRGRAPQHRRGLGRGARAQTRAGARSRRRAPCLMRRQTVPPCLREVKIATLGQRPSPGRFQCVTVASLCGKFWALKVAAA